MYPTFLYPDIPYYDMEVEGYKVLWKKKRSVVEQKSGYSGDNEFAWKPSVPLQFGTLGGFAVNENVNYESNLSSQLNANERDDAANGLADVKGLATQFKGHVSSSPFLWPGSDMDCIFPRQRLWSTPEKPVNEVPPAVRVKDEIEFFAEKVADTNVPAEFLAKIIEMDHADTKERQKYNLFQGNVLNIYNSGLNTSARRNDSSLGNQYLAFAGGASGSDLYLHPLRYSKDGVEKIPRIKPVCSFGAEILQVTSSALKSGPTTSNLLSVRNLNSVSFVSTFNEDFECNSIKSHLIETVTPKCPPMDVKFNRVIPCEAAFVCSDGTLLVWDLSANLYTTALQPRTSEIVKPSATSNNQKPRWRGIEYGFHPRVLIVANSHIIKSLDLRSRSRMSYICTTYLDRPLSAMTSHPNNPFLLAYSAASFSAVVDIRYSSKRLMEWKYGLASNPIVGMDFVTTAHHDDFITAWSAHAGEVLVFPMTASKPPAPLGPFTSVEHGPPRANHMPFRLPPYYHSPLYSSYPVQSDGFQQYSCMIVRPDPKEVWESPYPPLSGVAMVPIVQDGVESIIAFQAPADGIIVSQMLTYSAFGANMANEGQSSQTDGEHIPDGDSASRSLDQEKKLHQESIPYFGDNAHVHDMSQIYSFFEESIKFYNDFQISESHAANYLNSKEKSFDHRCRRSANPTVFELLQDSIPAETKKYTLPFRPTVQFLYPGSMPQVSSMIQRTGKTTANVPILEPLASLSHQEPSDLDDLASRILDHDIALSRHMACFKTEVVEITTATKSSANEGRSKVNLRFPAERPGQRFKHPYFAARITTIIRKKKTKVKEKSELIMNMTAGAEARVIAAKSSQEPVAPPELDAGALSDLSDCEDDWITQIDGVDDVESESDDDNKSDPENPIAPPPARLNPVMIIHPLVVDEAGEDDDDEYSDVDENPITIGKASKARVRNTRGIMLSSDAVRLRDRWLNHERYYDETLLESLQNKPKTRSGNLDSSQMEERRAVSPRSKIDKKPKIKTSKKSSETVQAIPEVEVIEDTTVNEASASSSYNQHDSYSQLDASQSQSSQLPASQSQLSQRSTEPELDINSFLSSFGSSFGLSQTTASNKPSKKSRKK